MRYSFKRVFRAMFRLRPGAFLMCAMMNLFYCLKALRGNAPACFDERTKYEEFRDLPVEGGNVEQRGADLQVRLTRRA